MKLFAFTFFAYSTDINTLNMYMNQAINSAKTVKLVITSETIPADIVMYSNTNNVDAVFDKHYKISDSELTDGLPDRSDGVKRQWFTRLNMIQKSEYKYTWALDAGITACPDAGLGHFVNEIIKTNLWEYNLMHTVHYEKQMPHNWNLLFSKTPRTQLLIEQWKKIQTHHKNGDDQATLYYATGKVKHLKVRPLPIEFGHAFFNHRIKKRITYPVIEKVAIHHGVSENTCYYLNVHAGKIREFHGKLANESRQLVMYNKMASVFTKHPKFSNYTPFSLLSHKNDEINAEP